MKYNEYIQMKNFSHQENFAFIPSFGILKAGGKIHKFLKKLPDISGRRKAAVKELKKAGEEIAPSMMKIKDAAKGRAESFINDLKSKATVNELMSAYKTSGFKGVKDTVVNKAKPAFSGLMGDSKLANEELLKNIKDPEKLKNAGGHLKSAVANEAAADAINATAYTGLAGAGLVGAAKGAQKIWGKKTLTGFDGLAQKIGGKFTTGKKNFLTTGMTAAENQAKLGKKIMVGTGAGLAATGVTAYGLSKSGKLNSDKYYVFDENTGAILGSNSGYNSREEALSARNANFQGARVNSGRTLDAKLANQI